jgi:tRNA A-37 threonylcarbamoyl transferase component Bud32
MPLQEGTVLLNKYHIDRVLGEGGFGCVYAATELRLNMRVAIKELRAELSGHREMLERFVNEARAIAALNNPHIVRVLSYDQEGTHHYIILEFMDGGSLTDLIKKRGRLMPAEAAWITQAVCDGLAAAHQMGIVHRDIKPSNILLMKDGQTVKISDFGIAHVPQEVAGRADLTRTGMTMGTAWHMSPEQARGQKVDARGDLYSVGVMLYEMAAGYSYLEFTSDFLADVEKLKTEPPRPLPGDVPIGLRQIIAKALAKDPTQRYQSAKEMAAALRTFIQPGGTVFIPASEQGRTAVRPPSNVRRLPLIFGGIALIVVVGALFAIALIGNSNRAASPAFVPGALPMAAQLTAPPASGAFSTAVPVTVAPSTTQVPTVDMTVVFATARANAEATQAAARAMETGIAATLTAVAPTATRTPTSTPVPSPSPTASRTPLPTATPVPTATPTRQVSPIRLLGPQDGELFRDENQAPFLEWQMNTNGPLTANEFYRIQVYHGSPNPLNCNIYTKETSYTLPPSGQPGEGCDPAIWRFNTGGYNWRISFVIRQDGDVNHDLDLMDSPGRLFKWNK